jgi:2-keto-4-pentenoate hydratase/2-oxohepta-3-ene-1,7-dioic acid hydratase in catechol pathway
LRTIVVDNRAVSPSKIVCVGRNYIDHIEELNNEVPEEPLFFLKPNSAISETLHAFHQEPLHYEGELSFLFESGRFSAVGFGLDITKRNLQNKLKSKGLPWERCKAFDGSAAFSPFVGIDKIGPTLGLELSINGKIVQSGNVGLMINKPNDILTSLSRFMSLENGDVVMTGTPKGVGEIRAGDVFRGKIMYGDSRLRVANGWPYKFCFPLTNTGSKHIRKQLNGISGKGYVSKGTETFYQRTGQGTKNSGLFFGRPSEIDAPGTF